MMWARGMLAFRAASRSDSDASARASVSITTRASNAQQLLIALVAAAARKLT